MIGQSLPHTKNNLEVSSIWMGDDLPVLPALCIQSWLDHGFAFRLFTYRDYDNLPEGVLVTDASEVIPREMIFRHKNAGWEPFMEWFRNKWLCLSGGIWTDLDMACLRAFPSLPCPLFALEEPEIAGIGIISFPPNHPVMEQLVILSEDPSSIMPWDCPSERDVKQKFAESFPTPEKRREKSLWGAGGSGVFTRALKHFSLLDKALPPNNFYPVHYTVWRHCYNGTLNLNSPNLANSSFVRLWQSILAREPDAFDNVHKDSVVGQLLDKHLPAHSLLPPCTKKKKVSLLVGVCSSLKSREQRDAIRKTWMQSAPTNAECLFFLGRRTPLRDEPDTVSLWTSDDSGRSLQKTLLFFQYALDHYDFEWLFKCHDRTYVHINRLLEICDEQFDLIGDVSLQEKGIPHGGAGYLLSRKLVEKIISYFDTVPSTGSEDFIFNTILPGLAIEIASCECLGMNDVVYPTHDNDMISAYGFTPEQLDIIHAFNSPPIAIYQGTHRQWNDKLYFYENGLFRREQTNCTGLYTLDLEGKLTLGWFKWDAEILFFHDGIYTDADEPPSFSLERVGHHDLQATVQIL